MPGGSRSIISIAFNPRSGRLLRRTDRCRSCLVGFLRSGFIAPGYTPIIDSVKSQAQTLIEGTLPAEEAIAFINQVKSLVEELGLAALAFAELDAYFLQAQDLLENTDFDGKAELEFGVSEAASLIEAETCVLADFEAAIAVIWQAIKAYTAGNIEENLAAIATLTTSHCSTWETLEAVRDGLVPDSSHFYTYPKYGNWDGSARKLHWVQYEWEKSYRVTQIGVFWWTILEDCCNPM